MLLSLWKKLNFISCPLFPPPRLWLFKRRLKAKQYPTLELSVYLDVCQEEHSLISCRSWVSMVSTEEAPSCLCAMELADLKLSSAYLCHHCAFHHLESACASEGRHRHKKLVTFSAMPPSTQLLFGLHCLLETPAVSAQEVGMSIVTMHPGLSMCLLPPCLYHQPRSFLASRISPFFP